MAMTAIFLALFRREMCQQKILRKLNIRIYTKRTTHVIGDYIILLNKYPKTTITKASTYQEHPADALLKASCGYASAKTGVLCIHFQPSSRHPLIPLHDKSHSKEVKAIATQHITMIEVVRNIARNYT